MCGCILVAAAHSSNAYTRICRYLVGLYEREYVEEAFLLPFETAEEAAAAAAAAAATRSGGGADDARPAARAAAIPVLEIGFGTYILMRQLMDYSDGFAARVVPGGSDEAGGGGPGGGAGGGKDGARSSVTAVGAALAGGVGAWGRVARGAAARFVHGVGRAFGGAGEPADAAYVRARMRVRVLCAPRSGRPRIPLAHAQVRRCVGVLRGAHGARGDHARAAPRAVLLRATARHVAHDARNEGGAAVRGQACNLI